MASADFAAAGGGGAGVGTAGALAAGARAGAWAGAATGGDCARDVPAAAAPRHAYRTSLLEFMLAFYQKFIATMRLSIVNQRRSDDGGPRSNPSKANPVGSPWTYGKQPRLYNRASRPSR